MGNKVKYIAKPDTWFKEGTECFKDEDMYRGSAIYRGTYVIGSCNPDGYDKFWYEKGHKDGDEVEMREICSHNEFEIIEVDD